MPASGITTFTNPAELEILRQGTKDFISLAPTSIALIPQAKTKTASGGTLFSPLPARAAQAFKLIAVADALPHTDAVDGTGNARTYTYFLLGTWDSVMEEHDRFTDPSSTVEYEIISMGRENGYERLAQLEAIG